MATPSNSLVPAFARTTLVEESGCEARVLPRWVDCSFHFESRAASPPTLIQQKDKMAKKNPKRKTKSLLNQVHHPDAAGIDIGATEFYVAVDREKALAADEKQSVRHFSSFNTGIAEAAGWLKGHGIKTIAMESTGNYWVALYDLLSEAGFDVRVVNASQCKALPGRKTDVCDAQWIQQLHTAGLLRASYIPEDAFRPVRYLTCHRDGLIKEAARGIQRMQKAFTQMNVQLHHAVSDIDGLSGRAIIEAILGGERDAGVLADLRHPSCRTPRATVVEALTGNYRDEYLFVLGQNYRRWQRVRGEIGECERKLAEVLAACPGAAAQEQSAAGGDGETGRDYLLDLSKSARKHELEVNFRAEAARIYGVDLGTVPSIADGVLAALMAGIGGRDEFLASFASEKRFTSWLGQCPDNRITGGRVKGSKTRSVDNPLSVALRMAAMTLWRSDNHLGDYCRKMKARLGKAEGITATAHKLARIIYAMIESGKPYDESIGQKAAGRNLERQITNLRKKAEKLGLTLLESSANQTTAAPST